MFCKDGDIPPLVVGVYDNSSKSSVDVSGASISSDIFAFVEAGSKSSISIPVRAVLDFCIVNRGISSSIPHLDGGKSSTLTFGAYTISLSLDAWYTVSYGVK